MKKFTINCNFNGQMSPFAIYIGKPEGSHHPLHFQADWLSKTRGGMIPGEVMEAVTQLQELAEKNGVLLEELCVYALGTEDEQAEFEGTTSEGNKSIDTSLDKDNENEEDHDQHVVDDHVPHTEDEEAGDMASEGGHVEEED